MKRIVLVLAVALIAVACSSTGDGAAPADDASAPPTTQPASQQAPRDGKPEGPEAPDFTLALASGDSFTLYDQQKPVYMIFWAEW